MQGIKGLYFELLQVAIGYGGDLNYVCVSLSCLTDYELADDFKSVKVLDTKQQEITLREVKHEADGDYYRDEANSKNMADIKWRIAIPVLHENPLLDRETPRSQATF